MEAVTTYLVVSCEDRAPIIDQLWAARRQNGPNPTGLTLHVLSADNPNETLENTVRALKLVSKAVEQGHHNLASMSAEDWRDADKHNPYEPTAFQAAVRRLYKLQYIDKETYEALKVKST
jgi:hypothetical protein